jgi:Flp pilus assembly pilin Flp
MSKRKVEDGNRPGGPVLPARGAPGASAPMRGASTEEGAAMIEYILILGLVTALVAFFFTVFYPAGGDDLESMINRWGDKLATEIAGDRMDESSDAWGVD